MAQMDNLVNRVAEYLKTDAADIMQAVERDDEVIVITNDMRKYRIPAAELPSSSAATVSDDRPPSKARSKPGR